MDALERGIRLPGRVFALLILIAARPTAAQTPSAQEIMDRAREDLFARLESVQSYTVVQRVLGEELEIRWSRVALADNSVTFEGSLDTGEPGVPPDPSLFVRVFVASMSSPAMMTPIYDREVADRMVARSTEDLDGTPTWVLVLPSLEDVDVPFLAGRSDIGQMTIWLGTEDHLVRRIEVVEPGGSESPDSTTRRIEYKEFRMVDGMLHPFRVELTGATVEGDFAGRYERGLAALARARERLPELPEEERASAEAELIRVEAQVEGLNQILQLLRDMAANPPTVVETLELRVDPSGG